MSKLKIKKLESQLRRWGLRLRLIESLTWGTWGGAGGLGAGLLLALAARLWPLLMARWLTVSAGVLALAGFAVGLALAWLWPRPLSRLARIFDRRFDLAERLTTAVEIGVGRIQTVEMMAQAQLADAQAAAGRVDPRAMLPLRIPRRPLLIFGVLAVALTLSLWLPNPQEKVLLQRAAVREAVEKQIENLEAVREDVAQAEGLTDAERDQLLQSLAEAIQALDEGQAAPEEAVAALSEAEQSLADLQDPGAATVQEGLNRAAGEMADSELTRDLAQALAEGDYQKAARELASFSGSKGEALTREQELELAQELAQAAESLAESDPDLAQQLAQAAESINQGDIAAAREAIRQAAQQMGAAGERVERQEAVQGALSELEQGREQIAQASGAEGQGSGGAGEQAGGGAGEQAGGGAGGQQAQAGHSEDSGSGAPYDQVYAPGRLGEEGEGVNVGREGSEGEGLPVGDVPLPAPQSGGANVPYREVYADYAAQAGAALEGSYIPLGMKQYVRDYFSSLEP